MEVAVKSQCVTGLGNTNKPVKKDKRARAWVFTWNNYTETDIKYLSEEFNKDCHKYSYVFQEETGENGTKHLQGCFRSKEAIRFDTVKNMLPKCHIEKCGSWKESIKYCSKPETRTGNVIHNIKDLKIKVLPKDPLKGKELYLWQKHVIDIVNDEPDDRRIWWFYGETGCNGKTSLAKHICINRRDTIYVTGKANDIKYFISEYIESNGCGPKNIIFDFVRSNEDFVSYEAIETVKNGIFFSGKYEAKMNIFDVPNVIIFANFKADKTKLSKDRWHIMNIERDYRDFNF